MLFFLKKRDILILKYKKSVKDHWGEDVFQYYMRSHLIIYSAVNNSLISSSPYVNIKSMNKGIETEYRDDLMEIQYDRLSKYRMRKGIFKSLIPKPRQKEIPIMLHPKT